MILKVNSNSPDETSKIGESIGNQLKGNEIILLQGDLGAGKTLFTKGIALALGIDPYDVVSPTFTLINEFDGNDGKRLFHADLYRLGPSAGNNLPEIDDYIDQGVLVIEWAQFLNPSFFKMDNTIHINIGLDDENDDRRIIEINSSLEYIKLHSPQH